jgi:hypothetical protein
VPRLCPLQARSSRLMVVIGEPQIHARPVRSIAATALPYPTIKCRESTNLPHPDPAYGGRAQGGQGKRGRSTRPVTAGGTTFREDPA